MWECFRVRPSGGFWEFNKRKEVAWPAKQLSASQDRFWSIQLVTVVSYLAQNSLCCHIQSSQNGWKHVAWEKTLLSRSHKLCSYSRTSQHFKQPKGSVTCSQEPSNGPYPEPEQSLIIHFNIIQLYPGLLTGHFPSDIPTSILYALIFVPFMLHALPISSSSTSLF
jgi:hypothetical protein